MVFEAEQLIFTYFCRQKPGRLMSYVNSTIYTNIMVELLFELTLKIIKDISRIKKIQIHSVRRCPCMHFIWSGICGFCLIIYVCIKNVLENKSQNIRPTPESMTKTPHDKNPADKIPTDKIPDDNIPGDKNPKLRISDKKPTFLFINFLNYQNKLFNKI